VVHQEAVLERVVKILRLAKKESAQSDLTQFFEKYDMMLQAEHNSAEAANSLSSDQKREYRDAIILLQEYKTICDKEHEQKKQFPLIKKRFDTQARRHQSYVKKVQQQLEKAFDFLEQAWGNGQEMILFMTELTANADSMHFIELWGSASYFQFNQELLIYDVHQNLQREITALFSPL